MNIIFSRYNNNNLTGDYVHFLNENYVLLLAITFHISFYGRSMLLGENYRTGKKPCKQY